MLPTWKTWFNLGWAAGATVTASMFAAMLAMGFEPDIKVWTSTLKDWQTLIAAVLAVLSAIAAVGVVLHQIDAGHKQEKDRRERRHFAARIAMPVALVDLVQFASDWLTLVKGLRRSPDGDGYIEEVERNPHQPYRRSRLRRLQRASGSIVGAVGGRDMVSISCRIGHMDRQT